MPYDKVSWSVQAESPLSEIYPEFHFKTRNEARKYKKMMKSSCTGATFTMYKIGVILYTDGTIHKIYEEAR